MQGYSSQETAKLLGMSVTEVLGYVRAGFLNPERGQKREYRFGFQDLVLLRTAKALVANQIAPKVVRKALRALQARLPEGTSLTRYKVSTEGRRVIVRDQGTAWIPESGQVLLDFNLETSGSAAQDLGSDHDEATSSAEAWFVQGCECEVEDVDQAKYAYTQALALAPSHAGARINLGRIFHEEGQLSQAIEQYQQALQWTPDCAIAAYNLGIAFEDIDDIPAAVQAYETAVRLDENLEDAHYNLAQLYETLGQQIKALGHLKAYHRLTHDA